MLGGKDITFKEARVRPTADFNNKWYQVNYPCSKQQKQWKSGDNVIISSKC